MNPRHTVPVLDDNGTIVYESHAIMIYLVSKYGKDDSLYPKDPAKQSKVNAALFFESGVLFARMRTITVSHAMKAKLLNLTNEIACPVSDLPGRLPRDSIGEGRRCSQGLPTS